MYCRSSCDGTPVFFASLRVGVGQNSNLFAGRVAQPCSSSRTAASIWSVGLGLSPSAFPGLSQYPNPVPDVGGSELGRGETLPFRIVPERVKVL